MKAADSLYSDVVVPADLEREAEMFFVHYPLAVLTSAKGMLDEADLIRSIASAAIGVQIEKALKRRVLPGKEMDAEAFEPFLPFVSEYGLSGDMPTLSGDIDGKVKDMLKKSNAWRKSRWPSFPEESLFLPGAIRLHLKLVDVVLAEIGVNGMIPKPEAMIRYRLAVKLDEDKCRAFTMAGDERLLEKIRRAKEWKRPEITSWRPLDRRLGIFS